MFLAPPLGHSPSPAQSAPVSQLQTSPAARIAKDSSTLCAPFAIRLPVVVNLHHWRQSRRDSILFPQVKPDALVSPQSDRSGKDTQARYSSSSAHPDRHRGRSHLRPSPAQRSVFKTATDFRGDVAKFSSTLIQKKLRRLRIANIAPDVSYRLVDMSVGHGHVQPAIQICIEKSASKSKSVSRRRAQPRSIAMSS